MAEIRWTHEAATWLEEIFNYIAADDPEAARSTVAAIYELVQSLIDFPRKGRLHGTTDDGEIRVLLYGHYRIAYQVTPSGPVLILGVFHGALDIDRYL